MIDKGTSLWESAAESGRLLASVALGGCRACSKKQRGREASGNAYSKVTRRAAS